MPDEERYLDVDGQYKAGDRPVLESLIVEKSPLFAQLLGEFKEHDDDAYQMLCVAIKKLTADVRFQMEDEAYQMACLEEILRDLSVAYMEERMDSWEPDIEAVIQKYLA